MSMTPAFSPGPWITCGARGRQRAQMHLGGLVRAVLVPHGREDAELGQRRLAADQVEDALVLVRLEAVLGDQLGGDGGVGITLFTPRVPAPPPGRRTCRGRRSSRCSASTWFSGCGIMPSTLPRSLTMPAMALMAPLWFQFGSIMPSASSSGRSPGPRLPAARWSRRRRSSCPRRARPARGSPARHCSRG